MTTTYVEDKATQLIELGCPPLNALKRALHAASIKDRLKLRFRVESIKSGDIVEYRECSMRVRWRKKDTGYEVEVAGQSPKGSYTTRSYLRDVSEIDLASGAIMDKVFQLADQVAHAIWMELAA